MIHLFCGYDERESIGFSVFAHSVIARASKPVAITPLSSMGLPQGSNTFTLSRFLVPYLMGFKGHAIFVDGCDMLMLGDIAELDALFDNRFAVQVVQHEEYATRHRRKYVGTPMECQNRNYGRKNWASAMIVNCEHLLWIGVGPDQVAKCLPLPLLQFFGLDGTTVGALPAEWNVLVDEGQDGAAAKLLHWTAGIPAFDHYRNAPRAELWHAERAAMEHSA